jgi:ribulose-phosphate 3-epimerase
MKIAPSILDADFKNFQTEIDSIATADRVHLDIMDGQFVPNLSFGPPILKTINFPIETEAHLMVENPERFFDMFLHLGVSGITFHIENTGQDKALALLEFLKENNVRAGICIDGSLIRVFLIAKYCKQLTQSS